jgi:hypothetical protein
MDRRCFLQKTSKGLARIAEAFTGSVFTEKGDRKAVTPWSITVNEAAFCHGDKRKGRSGVNGQLDAPGVHHLHDGLEP